MAGAVARSKLYEAAGHALELNPQLPRAHAVLAEAQSVAGEHEAAIQSARRAVDFGPSDAEAHATLASVLAYAGRPAEAVAAAATALRLNPKPPAAVLLTAGFALFLDEQYERAIEALEQARDLSPDLMEPHTFLAMAYAQADRIEEARETVSVLLGREPSLSLQFWKLMFAHLREADDLRRCLEGLRKAGSPEWPFGYVGRPEHRIEQTEAEALTLGRIWQGRHESGMPFVAQMSQDGTLAFRDASSLRTGEFLFRDSMLCYRSDDFLQGRASCGFLYRDAEGSDFDYVYVNAFSLLHFSVVQ
jgi:tetratricopeptide (TPR) repeat protein